jgi:Na+/H+ antiporter NhaA
MDKIKAKIRKFNQETFLIDDLLLLIVLIAMFFSRFLNLASLKIIQPIFTILLVVHILQHLSVFKIAIKKIFRRK